MALMLTWAAIIYKRAWNKNMAIKKNELYSSLWASCDKLRGGMDASQSWQSWILRERMCTPQK